MATGITLAKAAKAGKIAKTKHLAKSSANYYGRTLKAVGRRNIEVELERIAINTLFNGPSVINYGSITQRVVQKSFTKTSKIITKRSIKRESAKVLSKKLSKIEAQKGYGKRYLVERRLNQIDKIKKRGISYYNNYKSIEQKFNFINQALSGDLLKPKRVVYYLRGAQGKYVTNKIRDRINEFEEEISQLGGEDIGE